jgi:hypothetical protein
MKKSKLNAKDILPKLIDIAKYLSGSSEMLPVNEALKAIDETAKPEVIAKELTNIAYNKLKPLKQPTLGRQTLVDDFCRLTDNYSNDHLKAVEEVIEEVVKVEKVDNNETSIKHIVTEEDIKDNPELLKNDEIIDETSKQEGEEITAEGEDSNLSEEQTEETGEKQPETLVETEVEAHTVGTKINVTKTLLGKLPKDFVKSAKLQINDSIFVNVDADKTTINAYQLKGKEIVELEEKTSF